MRALAVAFLLAVLAGCGGSSAASLSPARTIDGSYRSHALRGTIHYRVYLPAGYGSGSRRYPVVYLLHGLPAAADAYQSIGFITRPVERSGMPAIVVGAQGARKGDTDPEWANRGPGRDWETATARELVHVIDGRYRTIPARRARALIGISAGGYGATLIAIHNPSVYSVVQSWSGYLHATNPAGTARLDLGSKDANDWADAATLVPRLKRIFARYPNTHDGHFVGTNDPTFLDDNRDFDRALSAAGIRPAYAEYEGGHTDGFWRTHEDDWVTAALREFARPQS
ncbi:MAG TPA: alpha/beta hydrolase-fold protein [Gaiellaceae bacterium]|nr:alpha/beta hydrolase-fold protein [Gaiellaceae bacterium]